MGTNHGGEYFAAGVGGAITGRGADLMIIDDPHTEQDSYSEGAMDRAYEWYTSGPQTTFATWRFDCFSHDPLGSERSNRSFAESSNRT